MSFIDSLRSGNNGNLLGLTSSHPSDNYDGGINDFANQVLNLHKDEIRRKNQINDAILQHQLKPINRYSTLGNENGPVSQGLTGANTNLNTVSAAPSINPLDLAKLNLAKQKESDTNIKNQNDLGFKQSKESTDSAIRQQRADVYDYKSKHPDVKFDTSGATVKAMNPKDGSVYDTGLSTDKLSMEDRMNLATSNDIMKDNNRLNLQSDNNINRDNNRSTNNLTEIKARGNETRETNSVKPNTNLVSNSQINQGQINTATQLLNSHPEYAPYIKLGKSDNGKVNGFSVSPINGEGDPIYHDINNQIYGGGSDVELPSDKNKTKSSDTSSDTKPTILSVTPVQ